GARPADDPDRRELIATALVGYELAPAGLPDDPPPAGEVIADDSIRHDGVAVGDVLLLGPARTEVTITGFVSDTRYSGQATLWASLDTWREVATANRPAQALGDGTVQAVVVRTEGDPADVVAAIDEASERRTEVLTL